MLNIKKVFFDYETFSEADLEDVGISKYAQHPSTDVICLAYSVDGASTSLWTPGFSNEIPEILQQAIDCGAEFHAFNYFFERLISKHIMVGKYGWPAISSNVWRCTQSKAAYSNLPRGLQKISDLLCLQDIGSAKDKAGHKAMLRICKPTGKKKKRNLSPELYEKTYNYCLQDVVCEESIDSFCPDLPEQELELWQLDGAINAHGVPIDLAMCRGAVAILAEQASKDNLRLAELTAGKVTSVTQTKRLKEFFVERNLRLPKNPKDGKTSMDKRYMVDHTFPEGTDPVALEVLKIRTDGAKASCAKYQAALNYTDEDGFCRYVLKYFTAGPGRWGCGGPQFQNMPRTSNPPNQEMIEAITSGLWEKVYALNQNVVATLSNASRSMICAPDGWELCISDFAAIEARVLAWISDDKEMLNIFATGGDPYKMMATKIYNVLIDEVTKQQRQIGKNAILGCGYGMGAKRFAQQVKEQTGIIISEEFALEVIRAYRTARPAVTKFWSDCERAAFVCTNTGKTVRVGRLTFRMDGEWMEIILPSSRAIRYFRPKAVNNPGDWSFSYIKPATGKRITIWGGVFVENICQAIARDIMAEAMKRIRYIGIKLFLTVHDETVSMIPSVDKDIFRARIHECMEERPSWATDCPIGAETHVSKRFTK